MEELKLIIFDLDGTLVDAYPAIIKSFNYTMRKTGYPTQGVLTIRRSVGWGDKNLLKPFVKTKDLSRALTVYRRHHATSLLSGSRLFPGVKSLLSHLKNKGYLLAVASNRPTRFSRILIRHLKIENYFACILCADKLRYGKPHPQILNRIRHRFFVSPEQALYVGDMAIDVVAGRRARLRTVIVTTGSSIKKEIQKERPYRMICRLTQLPLILNPRAPIR